MSNPEDVRALIAVLLRAQDMRETPETNDYYLGQAQQWMESSWKNYPHPAGMDESALGVDEAIALLVEKGYGVIAPSVDGVIGSTASSPT